MKVELKKWNVDLKNELINICQNADRSYLSNGMPYPYTDESADFWLKKVKDHDEKDGLYRAIAVDGEVVGNISVEQKADIFCKDCEIGYILLKSYWSNGIVTEAVKQMCEIAFEKLDINRISGVVFSPNIASKRVLEKNCFKPEGVIRNGVYKYGEIYDACLYGKLKSK